MTDAERELLLTLAELLLEDTAGTYINRERVRELIEQIRNPPPKRHRSFSADGGIDMRKK